MRSTLLLTALSLAIGCTPRGTDPGTMVGNPGKLTAAEASDGQMRRMDLPIESTEGYTCGGDRLTLVDVDGLPLEDTTVDLTRPLDIGLSRNIGDRGSLCGLNIYLSGPVKLELEGPDGGILSATLDMPQISIGGGSGEVLGVQEHMILEIGYAGWIGPAMADLSAGTAEVTINDPVGRLLLERVSYGSGVYLDVDEDGALSTYEREVGAVAWGLAHPRARGVRAAVAMVGPGSVIGTVPLDGSGFELVQEARDGVSDLRAIVGGPLGAVAVGEFEGGPSAIGSADLLEWTGVRTAAGLPLADIAYGGGRHVIVGLGNQTFSAIDPTRWMESEGGAFDVELYAVTYGEGLFVAGGQDSAAGMVVTSRDGITWSEPIYVGDKVLDLAYGNGTFVAVGQNGAIHTSDDGVTWTERDSGTLDPLFRVRHVGDAFFVLHGMEAIESTDGVTWTRRELTVELTDIVYTGETYVGIGSAGAVYRSDDRATWTTIREEDGVFWEAAALSGL